MGAASFHIGTNREGKEWQGSRPVREVQVEPFCLDRSEVTVAAYKMCVDAGACPAPLSGPRGDDWVDKACNQLMAERMQHPVNCIDWASADAYCRWRGKRLPREHEWQLAAGRMDGRRYVWGDAPPGPDKANLRGPDGEVDAPLYRQPDGWEFTAPVGSFKRDIGPFGHMDLGGNVSEWAQAATQTEKPMNGGEYSASEVWLSELRAVAIVEGATNGPMIGVRCAMTSPR